MVSVIYNNLAKKYILNKANSCIYGKYMGAHCSILSKI